MSPLAILTLLLFPSIPAGSRLAWCDVDGDGRPDALALGADGTAHLLLNTGDGVLVDATQRAGLSDLPSLLHAAWRDLDGDAARDLLAVGEEQLLVRLADGRGGFTALGEGVPHAGGAFVALEWLDLDGDGRSDLHLATTGGDALYRVELGGHLARIELPVELGPLEHPATPVARPQPTSSEALSSGGVTVGGAPGGPFAAAAASGLCAATIVDSILGGCLSASAVPVLGGLMPLSVDFNVDLAGNVGMGTTTPSTKLDVVGDVRASGQLVSSAIGGAPLVVASSELVANLNADRLDGLDASVFSQLGDSIDGSEIVDESIGQADLGVNAVGSAEIAAAAVDSSELASGAVTNAKLAANSVDTIKVIDGTLLNSDISGSAAIAGFKVVPDFGTQDISTTGTLGVGTSSPDARLHVLDGSAGAVAANSNSIAVFERSSGGFLSVLGPDGSSKGMLFGTPTDNASGGIVYDQAAVGLESMQFRTGGNSTQMTLTQDGKLGIGTSAPQYDVHVRGDSALGTLLVTPGSSDSQSELRLAENTTASLGAIVRYNGGNNDLEFRGYTSSGESEVSLFVDRDGGAAGFPAAATKVGIGTASPVGKLHVVDATGGDGSVLLPANSIGPAEMVGEAGVASDIDASMKTMTVSSEVILATRNIELPTGGYILALGSSQLRNANPVLSTNGLTFIRSFQTGKQSPAMGNFLSPSTENTLSVHGIFFVGAGSQAFSLIGKTSSLDVQAYNNRITLLFFPTAYGAIDIEN